jgi:xanthosine phosphorylase
MTAAATAAAALARERAGGDPPRVGLILGSGLGSLADQIADATAIPYSELPGFPEPSVEGHAGRLVVGQVGGVPVACLQGRVHLYEGQPLKAVQTLVRTLKAMGCEILVVTNAAGSLRTDVEPGSLMMIEDHINLQPINPLMGPNDDTFGPRFPPLGSAYDAELRRELRAAAGELDITLHEGVFVACLGPNFETPAEIRAFKTLGGDSVGMSVVPEVIVARHCGLRVAAISVLTNLAAGLSFEELSHEQTLHYANIAAGDMTRLIVRFLERVGGRA